MSESTTHRPAASRGRGVIRFVREVVAELKKVVRPPRADVIAYTGTVLVFVAVVMVFVFFLDIGIGKLTFLIFGS